MVHAFNGSSEYDAYVKSEVRNLHLFASTSGFKFIFVHTRATLFELPPNKNTTVLLGFET